MQEILRAYAFVNVFVAHAADGDVDPREVAEIHHNVQRVAALLGYDEKKADSLTRRTFGRYWSNVENHGRQAVVQIFEEAIQTLKECVDEDARHYICRDLLRVANADGHIDDMEQLLVNHIARAWLEEKPRT